jgi:pyruvate dehydrogenase E2 component (dihydrolipoamide acetyltransferase)
MTTRVFASPNARRLAREQGLRIDDLTGTGPNGRIIGRDVKAAANRVPAPGPARTGRPQIAIRATVRVRRLLKLRDRLNGHGEPIPISLDDLLVKAAARAHRLAAPATAFNADVAVAIPARRGLVTPVLKAADEMPLSTVAATLRDLTTRADRADRADSDPDPDLLRDGTGGSVVLISLGAYDTEEFDAALLPRFPAVLAVGAVHEGPVVKKGRVKAAPVMRVTLSADPRVIEVTVAADWMRTFVGLLHEPVRILL